MCGFVGFTGTSTPDEKKTILQRMMDRIIHRGPNMEGTYVSGHVALGFRRLSIVDLSQAGAQPMYNEDKTVVALFNGEIYNFKQLRVDLKAKGHVFASNTDTEVLVHGYEEYGADIVPKLRGMFAFVVWNIKTGVMLGARDPFGIKPFYYTKTAAGNFLFASEIKSFLEHPEFEKAVNPNALRAYLTLQYSPEPETFFKDVYSLPHGHYFIYSENEMDIKRYWDAEFNADSSRSFKEYVNAVDETVHESVNAHRIGDVEVGSFLSGGVDSSYITACLMPQHTFSVGFVSEEADKFDETSYAAQLSEELGIQNTRKMITAEECFEAFPEIQYHMDQPQANPSSVPLWFLAKLAKEKVTVVLSGEGADELFAGYDLYADTAAMEKFKRTPRALRRLLGSVAKAMPAFKGRNFLLKSAEKPKDWFVGQALVFPEKEAVNILKPAYKKGISPQEITAPLFAKVAAQDEVTQKQYVDINLWMPGDILLKADRMCMAHSLELRVPFLDKNVMSLAQKIPTKYRINGMNSKVVLRHAANKNLPEEWAKRPKKGFPVPIRHWLRERKFYLLVREYFVSEWAAEFFEEYEILRLLNDHYEGKTNNARKIWVVYTFLVWYKRFFIDEKMQ